MLPPELAERVFQLNPGISIVDVYGLTEIGRALHRTLRAGDDPSRPGGRPARGTEVRIDSSAGSDEIVLRGPTMMLGYFAGIRDAEVQFHPASEIHTGDEGRISESGEVQLLGRRDHMLNLYGEKLHPSAIEQPAMQLKGIREALAFLSVEPDKTRVVLQIVADPGSADQDAIRTHLRRFVSRAFVPETIEFVPAINRTEIGGKLRRPRLQAPPQVEKL